MSVWSGKLMLLLRIDLRAEASSLVILSMPAHCNEVLWAKNGTRKFAEKRWCGIWRRISDP
jgi:hypothetical protein